MRTLLAGLLVLASFAVAHAQTLRHVGSVRLGDDPFSFPNHVYPTTVPVGAFTATPDTPGDELLYGSDTPFGFILFVLVPFAPRSGWGGIVPISGICVEFEVFLPAPPQTVTVADVDGDRYSDVVVVIDGTTHLYRGHGLQYCH